MYRNSIILIVFFSSFILLTGCLSASPKQSFCRDVEKEDFKSVVKQIKRYITSNKNAIKKSPSKYTPVTEWLKQQQCVKNVIPPEAIQEIYPARYTVYISFRTTTGIKVMALEIQQGNSKNRGINAGDQTLSVLSLTNAPDGLKQFESISKTTIDQTLRPVNNNSNTQTLHSFNDQQYLNFYIEESEDADNRRIFTELDQTHNNKQWLSAINKLRQKKATYHLLAATAHSFYDVKIAAVKALKELNDTSSIPYLITVAQENAFDAQGSEEATLHKIFQQNIIETLNHLTKKNTIYKAGDETSALKKGVLIWNNNR